MTPMTLRPCLLSSATAALCPVGQRSALLSVSPGVRLLEEAGVIGGYQARHDRAATRCSRPLGPGLTVFPFPGSVERHRQEQAEVPTVVVDLLEVNSPRRVSSLQWSSLTCP